MTGGVPHLEAGQRQLRSEVRPRELEYIRLRRRAVGLDEKSAETIGLALSGGGIRSATFNLGLLQALHRRGLLRHVDYLSTVSGGGFIGGWLSSFLTNPQGGSPVDPFPQGKDGRDSQAIRHLRASSNYLASDAFGALRIPTLLVRGMLLNFVIVAPLLFLVAAAVAALSIKELRDHHEPHAPACELMARQEERLLTYLGVLWEAERQAKELLHVDVPQVAALVADLEGELTSLKVGLRGQELEAYLASKRREAYERAKAQRDEAGVDEQDPKYRAQLWEKLSHTDRTQEKRYWANAKRKPEPIVESHWWIGFAVFIAWVLLLPVVSKTSSFVHQRRLQRGGESARTSPQWWRDLYERSFVALLVASVLIAFAALQPRIVAHFHLVDVLGVFTAAVGAAFFTTMATAFKAAARFPRLARNAITVLLIALGPLLLYLCFLMAYEHVVYVADGRLSPSLWWTTEADKTAYVVVLGIAMTGWLGLFLVTFFIDINDTSMHGFYRDRLSHAYLLEPRPDGSVRPRGDLPLSRMCSPDSGAPYHLLNVALNVRQTADRLRGRAGEFFFFSRYYVGGDATAYCRTEDLERHFPGAYLATAIATSAAAAAPNMGSMSGVPTMLMGLLNVRLGLWLPNPRAIQKLSGRTPEPIGLLERIRLGWGIRPTGLAVLLRELTGRVNEYRSKVYLSDGGHLENLGVYELLRRRCSMIIAGDAEADPEHHFGGLAALLRYARLDLGVEIGIDPQPLMRDARGHCKQHFVVGRISYPATPDEPQAHGTLIYVKLSVAGDEETTMAEYRARNPAFPHESTGDQFFSEDQFEAYRALGEKAGRSLFALDATAELSTLREVREWVDALCTGPRQHSDRVRQEQSELVVAQTA